MKFACVVLSLIALLGSIDDAYAKNWRRAKGTLYMTRYEDSMGNTLEDLPPSDRVIRINADLRKSTNVKGIKTKCKDTKRLKQRSCRSVYYYNTASYGRCLYITDHTMHNFTSNSRNIYSYLEALVQCPNGISAYFAGEGEIRRS